MIPQARDWFARATSVAADWPADRVRALKGTTSVAVVLPALDEEATVGAIVATIVRELACGPTPLVDDVVVLDSGSTDATAEVAARAGARVVARTDVLADVAPLPGKGEAMWRAVAATDADVIVFVDADLQTFGSHYVAGLLGPLLVDDRVHLVKALYERPLVAHGRTVPAGGGRVTELVARPLINIHWPQLAGVVQPLGGEVALRRELAEALAFPTGYGVELAMLVDTVTRVGLAGLAQVDLGVRVHRHHDDDRLARMATEIWQVALSRIGGSAGQASADVPDLAGVLPAGSLVADCADPAPGSGGSDGLLDVVAAPVDLAQFRRGPDGGFTVVSSPVTAQQRPPIAALRARGLL